ncbi:MAG: tetratricopeptide repeat protein [Cyanobacteria bacterium SZAS-4]|nr:tetratricopeptide repeat protein [Cyanobacteria bacterium SZAS-4]
MPRNNAIVSAVLTLSLFCSVQQRSLAAMSWDDLVDEGNRFELLHDYKESKKYYLQSLELARKAGKDTPQVAESQARLAAVCVAMNNIKEAEVYEKAALELALAAKRSGHPNESVTVCMEDLAGAYLDEAPASDQEYCYKKAIEIREKVFGVNHPNLARSYGSLAALYLDKGRYAEAAPLITKSMGITSRSVGSGNYSLPKQILHHAILKYDRGDKAAAEKMIQIAEDIETKTKSDRYRSTREQFMAIICADRGDLKQAEELYKHAIKKDEVSHPGGGRLANSYAQLARFYCQHHRDKDAQKYFELARSTAISGHTKNLDDIVQDQNRCAHHSKSEVKPVLNLRLDH